MLVENNYFITGAFFTKDRKKFETFVKQNERILKEFSNAKFTVFDRDDKDGFMMWFMKTIRDYFSIQIKTHTK